MTRWLAWGCASASLVLTTASLVLIPERRQDFDPMFVAFVVAFSLMGALIVTKRSNLIGWIYLAIGVSIATSTLTETERVPSSSLEVAAALLSQISFSVFFTSVFVFVLLLYPTGRLVTGWWRIVGWLPAVTGIALVAAAAFGPILEAGNEETMRNPIAIPFVEPVLGALYDQFFPGVMLASVVAIATLVARFVKSRGDERQQIKWLMYAGFVLIGGLVVDEVIFDALGIGGALNRAVEFVAVGVGVLGIPVATGIAILRYRLYDIDVLINRTLVYGALTAILAGVYLGVVFVLQGILAGLGGQSDLVVAGSTLAVAALFRPLRRRVQAFIDHYFYRRKYDASQTLAAFASRLRQEVDLDQLTGELTAVVRRTMQPAHVSVWLRRVES